MQKHPLIGVIGTRNGWSSERLADAAAAVSGRRLLIEMDRVRLDLHTGKAWYQGIDLTEFDALIIKKAGSRYSPDLLDRLEMLRLLEQCHVRIFSAPLNILRVLDRLSCTITLRLNDIPMPPTTITEDVDEALATIADYGEAVLKPLYTSKARGMQIIGNNAEARAAVEAYRRDNPVMYIQQRIELPGRDLGIAFLGGEYLTTYARCGDGASWNTTTHFGGRYRPYDPDDAVIELARRAQEPFGLDFTCVDVVETDNGPLVFEVSAFGGFRGILETRGIDVAALYVDYVRAQLANQS